MSNEYNDLNGQPRNYKNKFNLYPILVKDAVEFKDCVRTLLLPKADSEDIEIMQMSYLKFVLLYDTLDPSVKLKEKLTRLMQLVLRIDEIQIGFKEDGKAVIRLNDTIDISEYDFGKIRVIICEQNDVEMEDENLHVEVRKKLREHDNLMAKKSNPPSFIQMIMSYQYEMKCSWESIQEIPLCRFNRSLETISHIKNSDLLQQARYAGMREFKNEDSLPTWLSAIDKSNDGRIVEADTLKKNLGETFARA